MRARLAVMLATSAVLACGSETTTLRVSGTVEIRQISVAALTQGRLVRLVRDEGDTVWTGDTIAVLAQPGLDERIDELQARHAALVSRTRDLEQGPRSQELAAQRATLERAVADSVRAAADARRVQDLYATGAASAAEWDAARTAAEAAAARVREVREALGLLEAGTRPEQIAGARRDAQAAAAALAGARATRDELTLIAPANGIVLLRLAERGEAIPAGAPVVTLGLTREPWIRAFVGQEHIGRVTLGAEVSITVDAYPDTAFAGRIIEISPEAEFTPRVALTERERADLVFAIKVGIDDAGGRLKAGMPVDLRIQLAQ